MIRTILIIAVGLALTLTATIGPARAADAVTAELLCQVKDAIRWGAPAWSPTKCQRVASALAVTARPRELLGICISTWRWKP